MAAFTKSDATKLAPQVVKILTDAVGPANLEVKLGKVHYGETITIQVEFSRPGTPSRDARSYALNHSVFGLPADGVGRRFTSLSRTFEVTGLNTRAPKFPVLACCLDDQRSYKFPANMVAQALAAQEALESRIGTVIG